MELLRGRRESLGTRLLPPAFLHEFKGHAIIARKGGEPGNEATKVLLSELTVPLE